jgi:hypothetical protein
MTVTQPAAKCATCNRTLATHVAGCSVCDCPHRHPQVWTPPDGVQGFPGLMAEDRILQRRRELSRAEPVDLEDL